MFLGKQHRGKRRPALASSGLVRGPIGPKRPAHVLRGGWPSGSHSRLLIGWISSTHTVSIVRLLRESPQKTKTNKPMKRKSAANIADRIDRPMVDPNRPRTPNPRRKKLTRRRGVNALLDLSYIDGEQSRRPLPSVHLRPSAAAPCIPMTTLSDFSLFLLLRFRAKHPRTELRRCQRPKDRRATTTRDELDWFASKCPSAGERRPTWIVLAIPASVIAGVGANKKYLHRFPSKPLLYRGTDSGQYLRVRNTSAVLL